MYADFSFYQTDYLGERIQDEEAFDRLATRASERLDCFTFGRISQPDDKVRLAVCAMAEILYQEEQQKDAHGGRQLAGESNDGYSVSFASASERDLEALSQRRLHDAARTYLEQTGLMDLGATI